MHYSRLKQVLLIVITVMMLPALAKPIKSIGAKDIEASTKTHSQKKPLILYFSSTDNNCGPCLINNGGMNEAADAIRKHYNIVATYFQPWESVGKHKALTKKYNIIGLPTTLVIYKNKIIASQSGALGSNKAKMFEKIWQDKIKSK